MTVNGTISDIPNGSTAEVRSFDVTGSGAQNALFLNAGIANPPFFGSQQGGGITQTFTSLAGEATFSASIAAFSRTGNISGGIFSVLLDGVTLGSVDFGEITPLATERDTLAFTTNLAAGSHTLSLQATRPFAPGRTVNAQYFTNVSLNLVAVPEPATWAMMISGFVAVGAASRRRARMAITHA